MTTPDLYSQLPYTEILDNIDVGIALYDRSGNYLFVNTALINWRNIPRSEYLKTVSYTHLTLPTTERV